VGIPSDLKARLKAKAIQDGTSVQDLVLAATYSYVCGAASRCPEYMTWVNMRQRCLNPNTPTWEHYGGRGVAVSPRWDSFWVFLVDVGPRPTPGHSLDRTDVDGNYEPGNVRWATKSEQSRNRRDNNVISHQGEEKCIQDWADESGVSASTIRSRLGLGWSVKMALTKKTRPTTRVIEHDGEAKTVTEWARGVGITTAAMCARLKNWPLEKALTEPPNAVKAAAGRS